MTTYFAFKLNDATQQGIDELLANLDRGVTAPQHELHTRVTLELVDEILHHTVQELVNRLQSGESTGALTTLLNLLKSTATMLVRQMLGKGSNEEVARMAQYLRERRLELQGQPLFGFPLPEALANRFASIFSAVAAGQGEARRDDLLQAMLAFGEEALASFYDDFITPMELGFIKRKAAALGRSTLGKGVEVAMKRLIPQLRQKELLVFAQYFQSLFIND